MLFNLLVPIVVSAKSVEITLNLNGGRCIDYNDMIFKYKLENSGKLGDCCDWINKPLVKEGYAFDGWYDAPQGGNLIDVKEKVFQEDMTLFAHWTEKKHAVKFYCDYYNKIKPNLETTVVMVRDGEPVEAITAPKIQGYTFVDWYDNKEFLGEPYNFDTPVSKDLVLYAKYIESYLVRFEFNDGTNRFNIMEDIEKIKAMPNPKRQGYKFLGWYDAAEGGNLIDTKGKMLEKGKILYAHWKKRLSVSTNVVFDYTYGAVNNRTSKSVKYGDKIQAINDPRINGYKFLGWYDNKDFIGEPYDFNNPIFKETILYGKIKKVNTIRFEFNDGISMFKEIMVENDNKIMPIPDPLRDGYKFVGWYDAAVGGNCIDLKEMVFHGDITLYAHWNPISNNSNIDFSAAPLKVPDLDISKNLDTTMLLQTSILRSKKNKNHIVRFEFNDDYRNYTESLVEDGGKAIPIETPTTRFGYKFLGWYDNEECIGTPYDFDTPVLNSFTLYGKWIKYGDTLETPDINELVELVNRLNNNLILLRIDVDMHCYRPTPRRSVMRFRALDILRPNKRFPFEKNNGMAVNNFCSVQNGKFIDTEESSSIDLFSDNPRTGDSGIVVWFSCMAVSVLGFIYTFKFIKKVR